ncbi:MAG: anhydro-N-acetylmuramic acid kinase [Bacteroidetes bacterium]|nr:anhydro-N-acetylmuramic acid kinase [Bacteroidota bacterium]MBS1756662.1 anhydro-N-acetylmuramic acid kinase [Bacteroidota bacterium]
MNQNIKQLYKIAQKGKRHILGLMSGTSLDGLDMALCEIKNHGQKTSVTLLHFETALYDEDFKTEIKSVFSKKNIDLEKLCLLNPWIAKKHAAIINRTLKKWKIKREEVDLIASHGQTIYHAPKSLHRQQKFGNATLQIGDGDHLAVDTGIITVSDFRQKNIAAGAEGAPLALYGDYLLFSKEGEDRVLLNIGGIANFTYLPASKKNKILCTDTGPGNTMMDAFVQKYYTEKNFDENAAIAKKGNIHHGLLAALKDNDFFIHPYPKTTGPELFNLAYLEKALKKSGSKKLLNEDILATLNKFTADSIADAINTHVKGRKIKIFISGGGMHNPLLVQHLRDSMPNCIIESSKKLGINPDAKEAILFAVLANECVAGENNYKIMSHAATPVIAMGKISFPG